MSLRLLFVSLSLLVLVLLFTPSSSHCFEIATTPNSEVIVIDNAIFAAHPGDNHAIIRNAVAGNIRIDTDNISHVAITIIDSTAWILNLPGSSGGTISYVNVTILNCKLFRSNIYERMLDHTNILYRGCTFSLATLTALGAGMKLTGYDDVRSYFGVRFSAADRAKNEMIASSYKIIDCVFDESLLDAVKSAPHNLDPFVGANLLFVDLQRFVDGSQIVVSGNRFNFPTRRPFPTQAPFRDEPDAGQSSIRTLCEVYINQIRNARNSIIVTDNSIVARLPLLKYGVAVTVRNLRGRSWSDTGGDNNDNKDSSSSIENNFVISRNTVTLDFYPQIIHVVTNGILFAIQGSSAGHRDCLKESESMAPAFEFLNISDNIVTTTMVLVSAANPYTAPIYRNMSRSGVSKTDYAVLLEFEQLCVIPILDSSAKKQQNVVRVAILLENNTITAPTYNVDNPAATATANNNDALFFRRTRNVFFFRLIRFVLENRDETIFAATPSSSSAQQQQRHIISLSNNKLSYAISPGESEGVGIRFRAPVHGRNQNLDLLLDNNTVTVGIVSDRFWAVQGYFDYEDKDRMFDQIYIDSLNSISLSNNVVSFPVTNGLCYSSRGISFISNGHSRLVPEVPFRFVRDISDILVVNTR